VVFELDRCIYILVNGKNDRFWGSLLFGFIIGFLQFVGSRGENIFHCWNYGFISMSCCIHLLMTGYFYYYYWSSICCCLSIDMLDEGDVFAMI